MVNDLGWVESHKNIINNNNNIKNSNNMASVTENEMELVTCFVFVPDGLYSCFLISETHVKDGEYT